MMSNVLEEYQSDSEESGDEESDGWEEVNEDNASQDLTCLVCLQLSNDSDSFFQHLLSHDGWADFLTPNVCPVSDQYDWIRFVNCIRQKNYSDWRQVLNDADWSSKSANLLHCTMKDDAVLSIDVESILEEHVGQNPAHPTPDVKDDLREENLYLRSQIETLKKTMADICALPVSDPTHECNNQFSVQNKIIPTHLQNLGNPSLFSAYRNFIKANSHVYFHGKRVLDYECGTALLSVLAAEAGASTVYAFDSDPEAIAIAEQVVEENHQSSNVVFLRKASDLSDAHLKIDVVLHQPTQCFLTSGPADTNSTLLRPDEQIRYFPQFYSLKLLPISCDRKLRYEYVDKWSDLSGYRLGALHEDALSRVHMINLNSYRTAFAPISSEPLNLYTLDFSKSCGPSAEDFPFSFMVESSQRSNGPVQLDALLVFFELYFDKEAPCQVVFTTSPLSASTCFKPAVLFLANHVAVHHGDHISGNLSVKDDPPKNLELTLRLSSSRDNFSIHQKYSFIPDL